MFSPKKKFSPKTIFSQKKNGFYQNISFLQKTYVHNKNMISPNNVFSHKKNPKKIYIFSLKHKFSLKKSKKRYAMVLTFGLVFSSVSPFLLVSSSFFLFFPFFHPINSSNLTPGVWHWLPWPCFLVIYKVIFFGFGLIPLCPLKNFQFHPKRMP